MKRNYLLNLANRSTRKAFIPLARPKLRPVFMPPAPTLPVPTILPVPPPMQATKHSPQHNQPSHSPVLSEQRGRDLPRRSGPLSIGHEQPSGPVVQQKKARSTVNKQALSIPPKSPSVLEHPGKNGASDTKAAELPSTPFRIVHNAQPPPISKVVTLEKHQVYIRPGRNRDTPLRTKETENRSRSNQSRHEGPTEFPHSSISPVDASVLPKVEKPQILSVSQPTLPVIEKKPAEIQSAEPTPIASGEPAVQPYVVNVERIVKPEPQKAKERHRPQTVFSEPQQQPPVAASEPTSISDTPEPSFLGKPGATQSQKNFTPLENNTPVSQPLVPKIMTERSGTAETPARAVPPESPESVVVKRVRPAPQQEVSPHSLPVKKHSQPPIQVSIGTIDLRLRSEESQRSHTPHRRRRPQGFGVFRNRRLYSGWELGYE